MADEDRIPRTIPNPKEPSPIALSRRAELRACITGLETIYDLYRGRACAHICIDSAYVAKAWGTWIPNWEARGWPGEDEPEEEPSPPRSRSRSNAARDYRDKRGGDRDGYRSDHRDRDRDRDRDRNGRKSDRTRDGYRSEHDGYKPSRSMGRSRGGNGYLSDDPYESRDRKRDVQKKRSTIMSRKSGLIDSGVSLSDSEDSEYDRYDRRSRTRSSRKYREPSPSPPPRRKPNTSVKKLVDEDMLRELADLRVRFADVEMQGIGSAHLYLIDRSHNPADKMAKQAARNLGGGGLLGVPVNSHEEGSRSGSPSHYERSLYSRQSSRHSQHDNQRAYSRQSYVTAGTYDDARSNHSGHSAESGRSWRSSRTSGARSEKSRKSTKSKAERERDDYLAKHRDEQPSHSKRASRLTTNGNGRSNQRGEAESAHESKRERRSSKVPGSKSSKRASRRSLKPAPEDADFDARSIGGRSAFSRMTGRSTRTRTGEREREPKSTVDGRARANSQSDRRSILSRVSAFTGIGRIMVGN